MIYVIMCGGYYEYCDGPKALIKIKDETFLERTIRLLKENGVDESQIKISGNDPKLDNFGVEVLHHENSFKILLDENKRQISTGYWVDAFYPYFKKGTQVTFLFGDVFYSENGLKTIVNTDVNVNTLFGVRDERIAHYEEPLAYKVCDISSFYSGIETVKQLFDEGKCDRHPIVWELYRVLNGININKHILKKETYIDVPFGGNDVDAPGQINNILKYYA